MPKKLDDVLAKLPAARRLRIEARAMELSTLKGLRKSRSLTQVQIAQKLQVGQDAISRIESRNDMLLSTLREYIQSLGGRLDLVVRFDSLPPVTLTFSDPDDTACSDQRMGKATSSA